MSDDSGAPEETVWEGRFIAAKRRGKWEYVSRTRGVTAETIVLLGIALVFTVAGVLHDSATAEVALPADLDPARSSLSLSLGTSPLAMIRGVQQWFRIYPYWCTEQMASAVPWSRRGKK